MRTAMAWRFALRALDMVDPGSIPGKTNLEKFFSELALVWVFWVKPQSFYSAADALVLIVGTENSLFRLVV